MNKVVREAELARLRPWVERARRFSGWDLSGVSVRKLEPGPPWDYEGLVREHAVGRRAALDLGTGGGELLRGLRDALPNRTVGTEEWIVNAPIARKRLAPLGVSVVRCKSTRLPFRESTFDLVINRHEELDPEEVDRVLTPGGLVVTQQVGSHNWREVRRYFPRMTNFGDLQPSYSEALRARGFEVESMERDYKVAYASLGEIVFMLCVAPWEVPEFDLERDLQALINLEAECLSDEGLVLTECRFVIVARKLGQRAQLRS